MRKDPGVAGGLAVLALLALSVGCTGARRTEPVSGGSVGATAGKGQPSNPLLGEWTGPYGGVPAFDRMDVGALEPALDAAMAENLREIEAIAGDPELSSFVNTIEIGRAHV